MSDYQLDALNRAISWVPQEPFLFSASIADNIALARPQATRAEIAHACELSAIHDDIIRMPQGFETPVGEKGRCCMMISHCLLYSLYNATCRL